jgi:hypothetical protein
MKLKNIFLLFIIVSILQACAPVTVIPVTVTEETTQVFPTITPTAFLCNIMDFDPNTVTVTTPDDTVMLSGQEFVKTWKIKNTGSCVWDTGYGLVFGYGEHMHGLAQPLEGIVEAGQEVEVSVTFTAPNKPGEYTSAWQMADASGNPFGKPIYVKILVK